MLVNQINEPLKKKKEVLTLIHQGSKKESVPWLPVSFVFPTNKNTETEQQTFLGAVVHLFWDSQCTTQREDMEYQ